MHKTNTGTTDQRITVDIVTLQSMLCVGRGSADRIAQEAGAVVRIGRRKLYNVPAIQAYIDQKAAGGKYREN